MRVRRPCPPGDGRVVLAAFARLRRISQSEHVELADVAQRVVDEAVRRARARTTDS
ncbi:hypothetical protein [Tsukamurella soli]|uniref:hypothetical protein n=1 Tax=Tsukamurella soli TaxID=644556 RepID=UPI00361C517A